MCLPTEGTPGATGSTSWLSLSAPPPHTDTPVPLSHQGPPTQFLIQTPPVRVDVSNWLTTHGAESGLVTVWVDAVRGCLNGEGWRRGLHSGCGVLAITATPDGPSQEAPGLCTE